MPGGGASLSVKYQLSLKEEYGLDRHFWLYLMLMVLGIGIAAFAVVIILGYAWYSWGIIGAFILLCAMFVGGHYFFEWRHSHDR